MIGKKVMHIDGNFAAPAPTEDNGAKYYIEDYLTGRFDLPWTRATSDIFYFTNKGMDISLFEIADEKTIVETLAILKKEFDVILIETAALDTLSQAKEWIKVSDKVVVIFDSNKARGAAENQLIDYLKTQGSKFLGWVMNRVTEAMPTTIKTSTKSASKKQA
jgi:predicted ATP-grasp superfamily ATP-dependent carboligase